MILQIHILRQIFFQCLQAFMLCWENTWVPQWLKLLYVANFSIHKLILSKQVMYNSDAGYKKTACTIMKKLELFHHLLYYIQKRWYRRFLF